MPRNNNGSGSNPRVEPKLRAALMALVEGRARTQTAAAKLAGMSAPQLSRALKKAHVQKFLLQEATRHLRGLPAVLAAARLAKLIDSKSDEVSARVATSIAENAGLIDRGTRGDRAGALPGSGPILQVVFKHIGLPDRAGALIEENAGGGSGLLSGAKRAQDLTALGRAKGAPAKKATTAQADNGRTLR